MGSFFKNFDEKLASAIERGSNSLDRFFEKSGIDAVVDKFFEIVGKIIVWLLAIAVFALFVWMVASAVGDINPQWIVALFLMLIFLKMK